MKEPKKDISSREDVHKLISIFYGRIRKNPEIGFYFNETIHDWPEHIEKLTNFWESNLFFVDKYRGNPKTAHQEVNENFDNSIEQRHFGEWLNLWFATIDENFEGEKAEMAKKRARNMAHHLFLNIFKNRKS